MYNVVIYFLTCYKELSKGCHGSPVFIVTYSSAKSGTRASCTVRIVKVASVLGVFLAYSLTACKKHQPKMKRWESPYFVQSSTGHQSSVKLMRIGR